MISKLCTHLDGALDHFAALLSAHHLAATDIFCTYFVISRTLSAMLGHSTDLSTPRARVQHAARCIKPRVDFSRHIADQSPDSKMVSKCRGPVYRLGIVLILLPLRLLQLELYAHFRAGGEWKQSTALNGHIKPVTNLRIKSSCNQRSSSHA